MRKRANRGTALLGVTVMTAGAFYLLASTPGPVGLVTRWVVGLLVLLLLAAMAIAALEAGWRWH